ncbi:winged helix-turn-helix domain-containing protein [Methanobrevibacter sp.]|uniref:winged helix-turn-helix domain-containing protein n=1 Tax=Methanobrevibacter sp. TaxID=66852 RepID=UPI00388EBE43
MDDELLKKYAYVISSTHRVRVMNGLDGDVITPTQISKKVGLEPKYVSKVLRELKEKELVECINEEYRKGRLYRLTDGGEGVMELLENLDW